MDSQVFAILKSLFMFIFLPVLFTWFWVEVFSRLSTRYAIALTVVAISVLLGISTFLPYQRGALALRELIQTSSCILVVGAFLWTVLRRSPKAENECEL